MQLWIWCTRTVWFTYYYTISIFLRKKFIRLDKQERGAYLRFKAKHYYKKDDSFYLFVYYYNFGTNKSPYN